MDNALKRLFDYQKFEGNSDLKSVIDSVHTRYAVRELDLDEMEFVSAAGIPETDPKNKGRENTRS